MSSSSTTSKVINHNNKFIIKLLDFVKFYTRYEKNPGFASIVSGLTYDTIHKSFTNDFISYNEKNNTLRIRIKPFIVPSSSSNCSSSKSSIIEQQIPVLTKYMSTMDDITTWGLVVADTKYGRPGLSLHLSCYPGPALDQYIKCIQQQQQQQQNEDTISSSSSSSTNNNTPYIELVSQVTKIGKNVGFVQYEVLLINNDTETETNTDDSISSYNNNNNNNTSTVYHESKTIATSVSATTTPTNKSNSSIICYGSQTKFLPIGYFSDIIFSNYGWLILKFYSNYILSSPTKKTTGSIYNNDVATILQSFTYNPNNYTASFIANSNHSSLGAPIHGGCQGMLMEIIGTKVATTILLGTTTTSNDNTTHDNNNNNNTNNMIYNVRMESIYVDYMSSPPRHVQLHVDQIVVEEDSCDNTDSNNNNNNKSAGTTTLSLRVKLIGNVDKKIKSIGHLRFRKYKKSTMEHTENNSIQNNIPLYSEQQNSITN